MTWNSRDSMPTPKRDTIAAAPAASGERTATPEKIPTYAQRHQAMTETEEGDFQLSQAQERELIAEGIWPERHWTIWRHAIQRGVQAYEE